MTSLTPPDRSHIESTQFEELRGLLGKLSANEFYAPRLAEARLTDGPASLDQFCQQMPFTTKAELVADQNTNPPFGTNLTFPLRDYVRYNQTSGTTGSPLRWMDTHESWAWVVECWLKVLAAAGVTAEDRLFAAFSFGPFLGFWAAFDAAAEIGCLSLPGGGFDSAGRLRMLLEAQATVLCCTPTYGLRLAEVAREQDIDLDQSSVRTIIVAGEPGGSVPAVRDQLSAAWNGARVFDHHGMTEAGPVTHECPAKPGLLMVMESHFLAEVLEPESLRPVEPGGMGELVLTTLGRSASPVLRYRTGDLVKPVYVDEVGEDGPQLAVEGGILGRADDMVVVRGVNVYPMAIDRIVRARLEVAEYRVEIDTSRSVTEICILVEPRSSHETNGQLAASLQGDLRSALSLRIPVHIVEPGALPRFELKARRWVRK